MYNTLKTDIHSLWDLRRGRHLRSIERNTKVVVWCQLAWYQLREVRSGIEGTLLFDDTRSGKVVNGSLLRRSSTTGKPPT